MIPRLKVILNKKINTTIAITLILFQASIATLLDGIQATERGDFKAATEHFLPLYEKRSTTAISYLYYFSQENSPCPKSIQALLPKDLIDTFNALPKLLADSGIDYVKASIAYYNIMHPALSSKGQPKKQPAQENRNKIGGKGRGLSRPKQNNSSKNQANGVPSSFYRNELNALISSPCPRAKFLLDKLFKTNQDFKHHPQLKKLTYNANGSNDQFRKFLLPQVKADFMYCDAETLLYLTTNKIVICDIAPFLDSIRNQLSQAPTKAAEFAPTLKNLLVSWIAFEDGYLEPAELLAGRLHPKSPEAALWFYKLLTNYNPAQYALECAKLLGNPSGKLFNLSEALAYAHRARETGSEKATERLCLLYTMESEHQDFEKAYSYSSEGAQKGEAKSCHILGQIYDQGLGRPIDKILARKYFKQAADLGVRDAQHDYALMCKAGEGGEVDYKSARTYFEKAIENGHSASMTNYAMLLYYGHGGEKDLVKARKYLKESVEMFDIPGVECAYGAMLFNGEGGERNFAEAKKLFEKSIAKGEIRGYYNFAAIHFIDEANLANRNLCFNYANIAAEKGCERGYLLLGDMYVQGFGCKKNNEKALEMYQKASGLGIVEALVKWDILKNILEEETLERAKNKEERGKKIKLTFKPIKVDSEETKPEPIDEKTNSTNELEKTEELHPKEAIPEIVSEKNTSSSESEIKEEKSDEDEFSWEGSDEQLRFEEQCQKDRSAKHIAELTVEQYKKIQENSKNLTVSFQPLKIKINKRTMNYIDAIFQHKGVKLHSFRVGQVCTALQQLGCTVQPIKGENTVEATFETEEGITHRFTFHKPHGRQDNKVNPNDRPYAETFLRAIKRSPKYLELR